MTMIGNISLKWLWSNELPTSLCNYIILYYLLNMVRTSLWDRRVQILFTTDYNAVFSVSVLLSLAGWLRGKHFQFLWCSGVAILIFRAELSLYLGQILLSELFNRRLTIQKLLLCAIPAAIILIGKWKHPP